MSSPSNFVETRILKSVRPVRLGGHQASELDVPTSFPNVDLYQGVPVHPTCKKNFAGSRQGRD